MSRQTTAHVRGQGGSELVVQHSHSDAPLLPIQGVERLHAFRPDRVDWVFEQTEIEAQSRRNEEVRVNTFIFVERMAGVVSALLVGCLGVSGGIYVACGGMIGWVA